MVALDKDLELVKKNWDKSTEMVAIMNYDMFNKKEIYFLNV